MASFEKLTDRPKSTRATMMKQMNDLDLDIKGKPTEDDDEEVGSSPNVPKGPNKYTVPRPKGMSLKEHEAAVKKARMKAGEDD